MNSAMPKKKNGLMSVVRETIRVYTVNEMSVYAGYTTLYILMAMVPLLTLVIGVVNLLPDVSLQHVEQALHDLLPNLPEVHSMLHNIIANVNRQAGSLAVSVSVVATLWSASNGVNAIQMGLSKISGRGGSYLRQRSAAMLYTVLFIALIPAIFIFHVLRGSIETLINALNTWLSIPDIAGRILNFMEYSGLVTAAAMAIIILLAYTYLQGVRRKLRYQLPGTLFTTLLWLGFSSLFEIFIKRFWQASSLYGSLASVFLAAMWLKTIVMILFYGAALNEALIHRAAEKRAGN
ncbi:MAG: YihY/virulence factor BrkB family protein [Oscillospiraceae bacterium]|nr:YihY/virulence factor BrkB family protein [Oscillospiraceae bacterium]